MKFRRYLPILFLSLHWVWADPGQSAELYKTSFVLEGPDSAQRFDLTSQDLGGVLALFEPSQIGVSQYQVIPQGPKGMPRMQFLATVEVLGISKSGWFIGDAEKAPLVCDIEGPSARFYLHLTDSDSFIYSKVSDLMIDLCATPNAVGGLNVVALGSRLEGARYTPVIGPFVDKMLSAQIDPMLVAFQKLYVQKSLTPLY